MRRTVCRVGVVVVCGVFMLAGCQNGGMPSPNTSRPDAATGAATSAPKTPTIAAPYPRPGVRAVDAVARDELMLAHRAATLELLFAEGAGGTLTAKALAAALGRSEPDLDVRPAPPKQAFTADAAHARFPSAFSPVPGAIYVHLTWTDDTPHLLLMVRVRSGATLAVAQAGGTHSTAG